MEASTPTAMETYKRQQAFRIKKAIMAWKAKKRS